MATVKALFARAISEIYFFFEFQNAQGAAVHHLLLSDVIESSFSAY
jgi:hypothetical protein